MGKQLCIPGLLVETALLVLFQLLSALLAVSVAWVYGVEEAEGLELDLPEVESVGVGAIDQATSSD